MNPKDKVFTVKYRPTLDNFIGSEIKEKIKKYLEKPDMLPNFIFESKYPGTGKGSLVYALIKELKCQSIIINSSDERNIDTVRNKIKQFAITKSFNGRKKLIVLDEVDGMAEIPQNALRPIMELYTSNVFFILTCNNKNKIIGPIQSRCIPLNFSYPERKDIHVFMENIVKEENMDYTEDALNLMIEKFYPSIRNMVLFLQDLKTIDKKLIVENVKPNEYLFEKMYKYLEEKDWESIKEAVLATNINPRELNSFFFHKAIESNNIKMIQLCAMNERDFSIGADPKIIMVTSLLEMVK